MENNDRQFISKRTFRFEFISDIYYACKQMKKNTKLYRKASKCSLFHFLIRAVIQIDDVDRTLVCQIS